MPDRRPRGSDEAVLLDVDGTFADSADVEGSTPDPDLVLTTLQRLDGGTRAVFAGDTPYDVRSVDAAGSRCLTVRAHGVAAVV